MKEQKIRFTPIPSTAEVEAERERLAYRSRCLLYTSPSPRDA